MAKSPSEQIRELLLEQRAMSEREVVLRRELEHLRELGDRQREDSVEQREEFTLLRQDNALLRQRLDEHLTRVEKWDTRFWGLIVVLVGALLSLSAGLIVVLVKK